VTLGWIGFGRDVLPASRLKAIGAYLLDKIRIYGGEGRRTAKTWTRTERGGESDSEQ